MNKIHAPENATHCSEFMTEIPKGIVNKVICGCGITSLAIENQYPTVIVVPTVEIINNKVKQYPNDRYSYQLFGVSGRDDVSNVEYYLKSLESTGSNIPAKIIVTYDSFFKVAQLIQRDESNYRIVVDEFSELLDAYDYRSQAIDLLLGHLEKFSYVSYVSATPIDSKYYPTQLQNLDETEIIWSNKPQIKVLPCYTPHSYAFAACIIENYRIAGEHGLLMSNGHHSHAAYFFLNSVSGIKYILDRAGLPPEMVRVICATTEHNKDKLGGYTIGSALEPEKKFNFITCKAFKGADFYSESGAVFIVTNPRNKYTMISIDTDVVQIAGRIRNATNPFKNIVHHIYDVDDSLLSREEFTKLVEEKTVETNNLLSAFSKCSPDEYKSVVKPHKEQSEDTYLHFDHSGIATFNQLLVNCDWRKWETSHAIYCDGNSFRQAYIDNDFSVKTFHHDIIHRKDFEELCIAYIEGNVDREYIAAREPLVQVAYASIGSEKMKALRYRKKEMQQAVYDNSPEILDSVERMVKNTFEVGESYTLSETKVMLAKIYTALSVKKKAKATDLNNYFCTRDCKKRINGKSTGMMEILSAQSAKTVLLITD